MAWRVPILRHGRRYESLETADIADVRGGAPLGQLDLANDGLIRRDVRKLPAARDALRAMPVADRVAACVRAASIHAEGTLPVGDEPMGPDAYVAATASATGLPRGLVRANLAKAVHVLAEMPTILDGLTRSLDLSILDTGLGEHAGIPVGLVPRARSLAAVLPSNSPGVHSLWLPALALGIPVVLKPGSADPFTPLRLVQALIAAGLPAEAFGFYPTDHAGADALVDSHDAALVFGGASTVQRWAHKPLVEVHGPGWAKLVVGPDVDPLDHLDVIERSVAGNGGRSCINASTIVVTRGADALAEALATRLTAYVPTPLEDEDARLAAWPKPPVAEAVDARIEQLLATPGATDVSAAVRGDPRRRVEAHGLHWMLPTVVRARPDHPLAKTELGFPFVSVVEHPVEGLVDWLGPTLVVTALTDDPGLRRRLLDAPHVDRLHLGPVPTSAIRWDQPHEGNLFELLWRRRAVATP